MPSVDALVVDTSVLIKWFKSDDEDLVEEALKLRDRVDREAIQVYAPDLLMYEIGNVLVRKTDLGDDGVADVLEAIAGSRLILAPPEPALNRRGARIARTHNVSFYDAAFVALAIALDCPMVTADKQLVSRTRRLGMVIPLESELTPP